MVTYHGDTAASRDLTSADLTSADLSGVCLKGADLSHAQLEGANLTGADLRDAQFLDTSLGGPSSMTSTKPMSLGSKRSSRPDRNTS